MCACVVYYVYVWLLLTLCVGVLDQCLCGMYIMMCVYYLYASADYPCVCADYLSLGVSGLPSVRLAIFGQIFLFFCQY